MTIRTAAAAAAVAALLALAPASAAAAPRHGGKIAQSGHHQLEIVAREGTLAIHVDGEDGKPEAVAGATARAAVLSQGRRTDVALAARAGAPNVLEGTGAFTAAPGTVIVITLTMPSHAAEQARITLD